MAGKTCAICGKPSGMYPLCTNCFILKDEGKGKAYFITQPSIFEVKFTWKGNSYCYGITIKLKDNKVLKTWLKNINRPEENVNSTVIKEWLNTVKINPKVIKPYDIVVLTNTDNYLSPKQIKTLINYYRNQKTQLILESMYSPLLTLELFRKDEIWLETKDKIFSLDVVKEHFYKRIPLEYRGGIYYLMPF